MTRNGFYRYRYCHSNISRIDTFGVLDKLNDNFRYRHIYRHFDKYIYIYRYRYSHLYDIEIDLFSDKFIDIIINEIIVVRLYRDKLSNWKGRSFLRMRTSRNI